MIHPWSKFWPSILILKVQRTSMSFKSSFGALEGAGCSCLGFGRCWIFLTGIWHLDLDLDMVTGLWYTHDTNYGSLSLFWRCKDYPCPLSLIGAFQDAGGSWLGSGLLILIMSLVFDASCPKSWLSILILKVQRTSMSYKSWFGALEDNLGSWLEFCILILIFDF